MLTLHPAKQAHPRRKPRVGLAIAGGGPIGGIYELGVLRALDQAIEGLNLTRLDVYVGVSSGAFLAAGLANGVSTADMIRIFISSNSAEHPFKPEIFLRPAFREYWRSLSSLPGLFGSVIKLAVSNPLKAQPWEWLAQFGKAIPNGLFDNETVDRFLKQIFTAPGRTNDFRELMHKLYIVAVDLDSGETVRFGGPGFEKVPISKAVQASSALPGLYPPVEIGGRHYVDGVLRRTLHASVVLDEGVDLMLAINPLVAYDGQLRMRRGKRSKAALISGGLPVVLSQTFRTLIQSRMQVGFGNYQDRYQQTDLLLIEPDPDDAEIFFTNVFSYSSRHQLCEHAYQRTLEDLRTQRESLNRVLPQLGMRLREELLDGEDQHFDSGLKAVRGGASGLTSKLDDTLLELQALLDARSSDA